MAGPFGTVSEALKTLKQNHALLKSVRGFQSRKEMDTRPRDPNQPAPKYKEATPEMLTHIAVENHQIRRHEQRLILLRVGVGLVLFALLWLGIPPLIGLIQQWLQTT